MEEEIKSHLEKEYTHREGTWDVYGLDYEYFDASLSYEASGYRPITETQGLDFDPSWFTEIRDTKVRTKKYCSYQKGSKPYNDFWTEEFKRCNFGMTVNGYTITGDHYFFLNYYKLKVAKEGKAASGRATSFPEFYSKQYEYFHYIELCEWKKKDVCALKSRGVGFSEIGASLGCRMYSTVRESQVVYSAYTDKYLTDTLKKCWFQLNNLNSETEGGMRHIRQNVNSAYKKKASKLNREREESGFLSEISGVVVDAPNKLRGDRPDRIFLEESGSNPYLTTTWIQGDALVEVNGLKFGTKFAWGTGGDSGPALAGLGKMFSNPDGYNVLPFRHNFTKSGEYILSSFFIPAFTFVATEGYIDNRGVTNTEKAKEYYLRKRAPLLSDPKEYMKACAEYCFTPEDALALEGDNQFNTVLLSEQLANINLHKMGPTLEVGRLRFRYKDSRHDPEFISGVDFLNDPKGHIVMVERPILNEDGSVPRNLYVAGIDGIDMGQEDTSDKTKDPSKFAIVIKRRQFGLQNPSIVCYYLDRPEKIEEAHRTAMQLLMYYNCKAVLEYTRISVLQYFRTKRVEDRFLMRQVRATQSDIQMGNSKRFGVPATTPVIEHQLSLIAAFIEDYCHEIWFVELLEQALKYSITNKTKFDLIAAWGMAELGDEELVGVAPRKDDDKSNQFSQIGYYYDSNGNKHYGVIPKPNKPIEAKWSEYEGNRNSDPRYIY